MADFADFSNVLPDPNNKIGDAGQADSSGGVGPGFKSVSIDSEAKIMRQMTNSGRLVSRSDSGHKFTVSITYNPLTREQFEPVFSFLMRQRGRLRAFFLSLPQNKVSQSTTFAKSVRPTGESVGGVAGLGLVMNAEHATLGVANLIIGQQYTIVAAGNTTWSSVGSAASSGTFVATAQGSGTGTVVATYSPAGQDSILMTSSSSVDFALATHGAPKPGDFFTVTDSSDTLHTKMYRVVAVETNSDYRTNLQPPTIASDQTQRLHISPALQRNLYDGAVLNFHDPKMRVTMAADVQQYQLNTQNLYSFSLKLEEAQK
jgi:hypothetical protein